MHVRMFVWYGAHTDMRLLFQNMQLEWEPPLKCFRGGGGGGGGGEDTEKIPEIDVEV